MEEIGTSVTDDFNRFFFGIFPEEEREYPLPTPIDQLAGEYLELEVVFTPLSADRNVCGLTAYTDTSFTTEVDGTIREYFLKENQIVLDKGFIQPG